MMGIAIDLTGQRFGEAIAKQATGCMSNRSSVWECLCDCGKTFETTTRALRSGNTKSCGCLKLRTPKHAIQLLPGSKFGDLTVIEPAPSSRQRAKRSFVSCSCGNTTLADNTRLINGKTSSCGCKNGRSSIIGKTFGRLTVTALSDKTIASAKRLYYECTCSCGNTTVIASSKIRKGYTQSCGCARIEMAGNDGHLGFAADPNHADSLSWIYLVEVDGLVDKIGIAFDIKARGAYAKYTNTWWKRQMTRAQCWAVEQCALHLTREYRPSIPAGNANSGPTEQRTGWVLDDVITMIDELCDECVSIGWHALYAQYIHAV